MLQRRICFPLVPVRMLEMLHHSIMLLTNRDEQGPLDTLILRWTLLVCPSHACFMFAASQMRRRSLAGSTSTGMRGPLPACSAVHAVSGWGVSKRATRLTCAELEKRVARRDVFRFPPQVRARPWPCLLRSAATKPGDHSFAVAAPSQLRQKRINAFGHIAKSLRVAEIPPAVWRGGACSAAS